MTRPTRRTLLASLVLAGVLSGCGFALRQPTELSYQRVALGGFAARSPMAEAIVRELPASVQLMPLARDAQVQVLALEDKLYRSVVASTSASQVREFRLRVLLRFRFTAPDGQPLGPDTELEQTRDMSYTETAALGKEVEEAALLREMRADIARQLLQRLSALSRAPR